MPEAAAIPECLQAALVYAARGWLVVPLHSVASTRCTCPKPDCTSPGKHPRTKNGLKDASVDARQIRAWWTQWPDSNVGVVTGAGSGIVVVDVDPPAGATALAELEQRHSALPATTEAVTGRGGTHLVFAHPGAASPCTNSASKVGQNIDVRGDGGYIVAPPSIHASGRRYEWKRPFAEFAPAPMPTWLLQAIWANAKDVREAKRTARTNTDADVAAVLTSGGRNDGLFRLGCSMRGKGLAASAIEAALLAENDIRCTPPLDAGEVAQIAASVARYEQGQALEELRQRKRRAKVPLNAPAEATALTDLGNAERLVRAHGDDIRYCHAWGKWLIWDGQRWATDDSAEIERRAKTVVRSIYAEAAEAPSADTAESIADHARKSESTRKIRDMIALTQSAVAVLPGDLDADKWSLNVRNGIVDLRSGELRPHARDALITKLSPVVYDPDATCPAWEAFLERVLGGSDKLTSFVQRAVGYALTGDVSEQVFFFLYGTGANGKSTFLNVLLELLGDYAKQGAPSLLIAKDHGDPHPTEVADVMGARAVVTVEVKGGKSFDEALVKHLTGGDRIKARFMRQDFFEFTPTHKIFLAANHKPVIKGTDDGIWRRIRLVPFTVQIPHAERDPKLGDRLVTELPGILAWAIRGCLEWQSVGLGEPQEVTDAVAEYRDENDLLGGFIEAHCVELAHVEAWAEDLYKTYTTWCERSGETPVKQRTFGQRLAERGHRRRRSTAGRWRWSGIGLRVTGDPSMTESGVPPLTRARPGGNGISITHRSPVTHYDPEEFRDDEGNRF